MTENRVILIKHPGTIAKKRVILTKHPGTMNKYRMILIKHPGTIAVFREILLRNGRQSSELAKFCSGTGYNHQIS